MRPQLEWRPRNVVATVAESATARTVVLDDDEWVDHVGGQHLDIRLTAPDGYRAERSYSLSSGPGEAPSFTVQRVDDGEVSPFLVDFVEIGDKIEVRGPIGGYFNWPPRSSSSSSGDGSGLKPLLLIGGGSGLAPLRSMWRANQSSATPQPMRIMYSAQAHDRLIFADEVAALEARVHLTREQRAGFHHGRITPDDVRAELDRLGTDEIHVYICGPTRFVEATANNLVDFNLDPTNIRTERFG